MVKLLIPLGLLLFGWLLMLFLARRNEKKVRSEWETLLTPAGEKIFEHARVEIETNTSMVGVAMHEAHAIKRLGDIDEALRFLNIGSEVIERFTPSLLSLLAVMAKFSRMISAVTPVNPILPSDFHLAELVNLAHLHNILNQMLISTKQRFRLRLFIIGKGVSIASHYLVARIKNIVSQRNQADQEWEEIVGIGNDFQRLSEESIRSFRSLLEALSNDAARALAQQIYLSNGANAAPKSLK
jgi:hypothetical protein